MKYNALSIIFICLIAATGGYLFGFDFAVISGALPFLRTQFELNEFSEGFMIASLAIGAIIGCLIAGTLSDKYGRRPALLASALIFLISSLAMAAAPGLEFFIFARFLAGAGVGMASTLSPMYIAEISPSTMRGRMVAINQLAIVVGILVTNLVNYLLRNNGDDTWRYMFGLGAVPSLFFFVGVCWLPESPRWLVKTGKLEKAERVLTRIGNTLYVSHTMSMIKASLKDKKRISYIKVFKKVYLPAVIVGIGLAIFQQICGINVVFSYASNIFESIGASQDDQLFQTVMIGCVNLVFTLLAMLLVDKLGRKPLMVTGAAGLAVLYIIIAVMLGMKSNATEIPLFAAIGLYATTLGPVTWVLISEIFPNSIRSAAMSVAVVFLWVGYFVMMFTFPILEKLIGIHNTFYIYSCVCVLGTLFIHKRVRETKGKSLEEMDEVFSK